MQETNSPSNLISRRRLIGAAASVALMKFGPIQPVFGTTQTSILHASKRRRQKAQIAITLDLEMSRHYPRRGMMEWDFQKGNLDQATKDYSVHAAELVRTEGGLIHFFCVGRVLEQADIGWLETIHDQGHPIGNHTYDHVAMKAEEAIDTQFRFQRAPWLVEGRTALQVIRENIQLTELALRERAAIDSNGFRTPGGFSNGLDDRPDLQSLLLDLGFTWVSSKYPSHQSGVEGEAPGQEIFDDIVQAQRNAQPYVYPSGLLEIPMSPISDVTAFRAKRWSRDAFLEAIRQAIEWTIEERGVFDFLCHPSCMLVEDPEFETLQMICDLVNAEEDRCEFATLDQVAASIPEHE